MPKALIFDFDGPFVISFNKNIDWCIRMNVKYQKSLALPKATDTEAWKKLVGFPMVVMLTNMGFSAEEAKFIHKNDYVPEFKHQKDPAPLHPEVKDIIRRLKDDGNRVGIVSLNHRHNILASLGPLVDSFEVIHSYDEFPEKMPALIDAANQLGSTAKDAIYVGDDIRDYHAAMAAGMRFIGVSYGWNITGEEPEFPSAKTPRELESMLSYY